MIMEMEPDVMGTEDSWSGGRTMCGRFTLFEADKVLSREFGAQIDLQ
jgi:hypothetical protein